MIQGKMRCDACEHWTRVSSPGNDYLGADRDEFVVGDCDVAAPLWEATDWKKVGNDTVRVLKEEYRDIMIFAQDGSDYSASVLTKPEFFCAHFKAKIQIISAVRGI